MPRSSSPQDNSIKSLLLMPLISFLKLIFLDVCGLAVRSRRVLGPSPPSSTTTLVVGAPTGLDANSSFPSYLALDTQLLTLESIF